MDTNAAARNLKDGRTWRRLIYIAVFVIAFAVVEVVLWAVVVVQFFARLFSGRHLDRAADFGHSLAAYAYQIVCFLTFRTNDPPWPFAPWPEGLPVEPPTVDANIPTKSQSEAASSPVKSGKRPRRTRKKMPSSTTSDKSV